jgi:hypothetical protein
LERNPRRSGFRPYILARRNLRPLRQLRYSGAELRRIRAEKGVGRPIRGKG